MTASKAKELTKQMQCVKQNRYIEKHERYAKKITNTKVKRAANKGYSSIIIKPSERFNKSLLADKIKEFGYDTKIMAGIIKITW